LGSQEVESSEKKLTKPCFKSTQYLGAIDGRTLSVGSISIALREQLRYADAR